MQPYAKVLENTRVGDTGTCACIQAAGGPQGKVSNAGWAERQRPGRVAPEASWSQ